MQGQCAVGPNGQLLDASEIDWHYSEDDSTPMAAACSPVTAEVNEGRGQRHKRNSRFMDSLSVIQSTNNKGDLVKPRVRASTPSTQQRKSQKPRLEADDADDADDSDFKSCASESDDSDVDAIIDNEELADSLPTKTKPLTTSKKRKRKSMGRTKTKQMMNRISETEGRLPQKPDNEEVSMSLKLQTRKRNPVYLFYEQLDHSPNGLVAHLKANVPAMYRLFSHLNNRTSAPTAKEIEIAAGRVKLSFQEANSYVMDLEKKTADI
ncbi:hypothetical protein H0H92_010694, partial [Tricholoma furcatifolium]